MIFFLAFNLAKGLSKELKPYILNFDLIIGYLIA